MKESLNFGLFDYLNCTLRTLSFTCSANQAFAYLAWGRFAVFNFVNAYRASVDTSFASGAFRIDNNFYHFLSYLSAILMSKVLSKIKGFRCFNVFFHVIAAGFR